MLQPALRRAPAGTPAAWRCEPSPPPRPRRRPQTWRRASSLARASCAYSQPAPTLTRRQETRFFSPRLPFFGLTRSSLIVWIQRRKTGLSSLFEEKKGLSPLSPFFPFAMVHLPFSRKEHFAANTKREGSRLPAVSHEPQQAQLVFSCARVAAEARSRRPRRARRWLPRAL